MGRLIAPLAYEVNPNLVVGGSVDFVWAMLDLKMAMPLANMAGFITPTGMGNGTIGTALNDLAMGGYDTARLDFSDDNDFTGEAKGYGFAGKLGFTYKINPMFTVGGTYHSKTNLGDMETGTNDASMIVTDVKAIRPRRFRAKFLFVISSGRRNLWLGRGCPGDPRVVDCS